VFTVDPKAGPVTLGSLAKQDADHVDIRGGKIVRLEDLHAHKGAVDALTVKTLAVRDRAAFAGDLSVGGTLTLTNPLAVASGGTGRNTSTTAYGLLAAGTTADGAHQTLAAGLTTQMLVGGGAAALPVWTTATGSGAPVRAVSPTVTGTFTAEALTATGNVILGDAQADTLNVGNGDIVKDGSGRTGFGKTPAAAKVEVNGVVRSIANNGGYFTKEAVVGAGGNLTITAGTRGFAIVSDQSNSATSLLLFDAGTGVLVVVSETTAGKLVTVDPGAGTSKVWVSISGTDLVFTSRWAGNITLHVALLGTAGLPS
jgi:hypothetical protein